MSTVKQKPESGSSKNRVAQKLHAEDIEIDDFVAVSQVAYQFPSFCWCPSDMTMLPPGEPVRIVFLPGRDIEALQVKSVCLPFVLCVGDDGAFRIHDVRQVQLVRLDRDFAQIARDSARKSRKRKKKSRKKSGK